MEPEDQLIDRLKFTPPSERKRVFQRIIEAIENVPSTIEELWTNTGARHLRNEDFIKCRVDLLQDAGWDPGGWTVMEWNRLPNELQAALREVFPKFQQMIREESVKMVAQLKKQYAALFG